MGPIEWVRSLFGEKIDLRSGIEALTVSAFTIVDGLVRTFYAAGITNVISFLVDKRVVYMDTNNVPDDLPLLAQAAQQAGVLDRKFNQMRLVLTHEEAGVHIIFDVGIVDGVVKGTDEMWIDISGRVEELRVNPGETAQQFAERVRAFGRSPDAVEPYRLAVDAIKNRLFDALRTAIPGARVTPSSTIVSIVRPDAEQIGRFRKLGFGSRASPPVYRPVPTLQRYGAYRDPFYYYYYDPYYDFMSWVLINDVITQPVHDHWHTDHVYVVSPTGQPLYAGSTAAEHANDGWLGSGAVAFDDTGNLEVAPAIPEASFSGDVLAQQAIEASSSDSHAGSWGHSAGHETFSSSSCSSSASSCGSSTSSCSSNASSCSSSSSSCSSSSSSSCSSSSSSCGSSCSSGSSSCGSSCGSSS
jgi:hypothetical protein